MAYRKIQESEPDSQHVSRLNARKAQTCFGLAEEILDELEKGYEQLEHRPVTMKSLSENASLTVIPSIRLSNRSNGSHKIAAAAFMAANVLSHQLIERGESPIGYRPFKDGKYNYCAIEQFDPACVNFRDAKKALSAMKGLFEEIPDPYFAYPAHEKRSEGSYWIGPFTYDEIALCDSLFDALILFHNSGALSIEKNRFKSKEYYIDCDKAQMNQLMRREGLLEKGRGR